jgi:hypothetical protein
MLKAMVLYREKLSLLVLAFCALSWLEFAPPYEDTDKQWVFGPYEHTNWDIFCRI